MRAPHKQMMLFEWLEKSHIEIFQENLGCGVSGKNSQKYEVTVNSRAGKTKKKRWKNDTNQGK